ncbi:MAG: zinc-ribbon domain-containing protein [Promethearchaeota archaeon]
MTKTGYCKICKEEVEPRKKPMTTMQKVAWGLVSVATLGLALIVFLIYNFRIVKKKYCPVCHSLVDFQTKEHLIEEQKPKYDTSTSKGKVLEKVEKVKSKSKSQKSVEKVFCHYCGAQISVTATTCPSCNTKLK